MSRRPVRPGALTWVTLLWAALLLSWVQLAPLYRAADEIAHVDLVLHLLDGGSYADPGTLQYDPRVRVSAALAGLQPVDATSSEQLAPLPLTTTDVPARDVPYEDLAVPPGLAPLTNQMTQHPPLYYGLLAGAAAVLPGFDGWSFPVQLGALRALSALLLLPLPALVATTARRLGAAPPVASAAALLPLAVPQLAHVGAAVTNDTLLTLLGATVALPLVAVSRGDVSRRTAVGAGVLLGLALLTKAFAVGLVAWAALAYALALLGPARVERARAVTSGLLAAAVAMAVGGWWWVGNLVRFGTLQPQGQPLYPELENDPQLLAYVRTVVGRVTTSTWGSFGWLEVDLPLVVRGAAALVVVVGLALAVARTGERAPWARAAGAVALAAFVVQCGALFQQSLKNYLRGGYVAGLQGRYLFALLGVVAALTAVGLARLLPRRLLHRAPLLALLAVVGMQVVGLLTALRGFWWAPGASPWRALEVQAAWAPFPPVVTVAAALLAVGCGVQLARTPARPARRAAPSRPATQARLRDASRS